MTSTPDQALVGPGRLVLVVGPSGSGKDTIINGARMALSGNAAFVFPRRTVTRPTSAAEDHDSLGSDGFDQAVGRGQFAFWWQAHGLKYGIPRTIGDDICAGRTVVCNVSRGITGEVRSAYQNVSVVLVTASPAVLAVRLAVRSRSSDGPIDDRVGRATAYADMRPDHTIDNTGTPEQAIGEFLRLLGL